MQRRLMLTLALAIAASPAAAQNWSFDARSIALGSPGGGESLAGKMIEDTKDYRSIVLPFGLFQVLQHRDDLDPTKDNFDIIRAVEYAASPIHYTAGRDGTNSGQTFVVDVRNATLSTDLNRYRGFVPANQPQVTGLAAPNWGATIKLHKGSGGSYQGLFVGAGPYFAMQTDLQLDPQLLQILGASSDTYLRNVQMNVRTGTRGELALAITGGYRGRFALPDAASERDGVYVALNYNVLRGFNYEDANLALRLSTNNAGLLSVLPAQPSSLLVTRNYASSGTGRAVDIGVGVVRNRWEVGFGANGIGNQLTWTGVRRSTYALRNLFLGDDTFVESPAQAVPDTRVELPVDYRGNVGYDAERWRAVAEVGRGLNGKTFHGGLEQRFGRLHVRGGALYVRQMWNPTVGVGLPLASRLSLDLAAYGNTANVERVRHTSIAASLRFGY